MLMRYIIVFMRYFSCLMFMAVVLTVLPFMQTNPILQVAQAAPASLATQVEVPSAPAKGAMPLLPYMEWMLDDTGKLDIDGAAMPARQTEYRPLHIRSLPNAHGALWIRMVLSARPTSTPAGSQPHTQTNPLLLDLGYDVPGTPILYTRSLSGDTSWTRLIPNQGNTFILPEAGTEPQTLYIRLDGLPSVWFAPLLRTSQNALTAMDRFARPALLVALLVAMVLCLVRGLSERGEWRLWTGAFVATALYSAYAGLPVTGTLAPKHIAAALTPGVALMLLAHVGRHLLRTRQLSRALDVQYLALILPGAALALLPLTPGFAWTARYLDLWPVGTLIFVPTTVGAWLCGLPGARRFLLACLLPPVGMAVALIAPVQLPPACIAHAPMLALALGVLFIAGAATPREHAAPAPAKTTRAQTIPPESLIEDDPNLRIVPVESAHIENSTDSAPPHSPPHSDAQSLALEEALRTPLDTLLRDGAALEQCSLPPAARQLCQSMLGTIRTMTAAISGALVPTGARASAGIFDVQEVLRQAHDAVLSTADAKNIALSWFMPPHLSHRYAGDGAWLADVLRNLLESAIRAASNGAVQVAVRRVPESINPGHLLFSVSDTGTGMPPKERSSLALVRAWELAGAYRGFLGLESGPHGASISFTMHLEVASAEARTPAHSDMGVIVVDDSASNRQLLAFFLEGLPCHVAEARNLTEAIELHERRPARLLIFDADMPIDLPDAVARLRAKEGERGLSAAALLALIGDDSDSGATERLREAGFAHVLHKPITRAGLCDMVSTILMAAPATPVLLEPEGGFETRPYAPALSPIPEDGPPVIVPVREEIQSVPKLIAVTEGLSLGVLADTAPILDTGAPDTPQATPVFAPLSMAHSLDKTLPLDKPHPLDVTSIHTSDVWVGEPVPVPRVKPVTPAHEITSPIAPTLVPTPMPEVAPQPIMPPLSPLSMGTSRFASRDSALEWVGEPMPIIKPQPMPAQAIPAPQVPAPIPVPLIQTAPELPAEPLRAPEPSFVPLSLKPPVQAQAAPASRHASLIPPSMALMDFIIADPEAETPFAPVQGHVAPQKSPAPVPPVSPSLTLSQGVPVVGPPQAEAQRRVYANIGEPMPIVRSPSSRESQGADGPMPLEALLEDFDQSVTRARQAFENAQSDAVRHAARHIAFQADTFGLRALARMARCVEDAAKASDTDALTNLLPELESFVERNRIAMRNR